MKLSKDMFIAINTSFVDQCITYYSKDAIRVNPKALKVISEQNKNKTRQVKEAFS